MSYGLPDSNKILEHNWREEVETRTFAPPHLMVLLSLSGSVYAGEGQGVVLDTHVSPGRWYLLYYHKLLISCRDYLTTAIHVWPREWGGSKIQCHGECAFFLVGYHRINYYVGRVNPCFDARFRPCVGEGTYCQKLMVHARDHWPPFFELGYL